VVALKKAIAAADELLLATPEYNNFHPRGVQERDRLALAALSGISSRMPTP
jgi:hypothetical protein